MIQLLFTEIRANAPNEDTPLALIDGTWIPLVQFPELSQAATLLGVNLVSGASVVGSTDQFQNSLAFAFQATRNTFNGGFNFPIFLQGFQVTAGTVGVQPHIFSANNVAARTYFCFSQLFETVHL